MKEEGLEMEIYWWQGGIHIQPETEEERKALVVIVNNLNFVKRNNGVKTGPNSSLQGNN